MLLAQAFAEYGAMAELVTAIDSGLVRAESVLRSISVTEYALAAVAVIVLAKVIGRR